MQKEYSGPGCLDAVAGIVSEVLPKSIMLIHGSTSYARCGAQQKLGSMLDGYHVTHYSGFEKMVEVQDVEAGVELFRQNSCDLIIAVGGGTMLDMGKSIAAFSANPGGVEDYLKEKRRLAKKGCPVIAIPTTAGSGSEATRFAAIYLGGKKHSVEHEYLLPNYAIIDPELHISMPRRVAASTGMDALSQAMESYWSTNSTEESKRYAEDALRLAVVNLALSCNEPSLESRYAMARAANLAGKAINISKTTACHSFSYPMTAHWGIIHGHAVALTLGEVLFHNAGVTEKDVNDKRGVEYVRRTMQEIFSLMGAKTPDEAKRKVSALMEEIGLETRLHELGIDEEGIKAIIEEGFTPNRVKNNPRNITVEQLKDMLYRIL